MSSSGTPDERSYQRQPAPGQQIDPRNPPTAKRDRAPDDLDKAPGKDPEQAG